MDQGKRRHVVVPHGRRQPPGDHHPCAGRSAASGGRSRVSRLVPSGLSQSRLASDRIGNRPASNPRWSANRNPNRLAICGNLRVEPEPPPGEGLDVALLEVGPVDLAAVAELPEDRLQREDQVFGLGVRARPRHRPSPR